MCVWETGGLKTDVYRLSGGELMLLFQVRISDFAGTVGPGVGASLPAVSSTVGVSAIRR